ncbi:MAG: universal stress protein [Rubrivivax sp.]|nr:universal stress protein [Rubrivivax sp.]
MNDKVLACIDSRGNTGAVIAWAAWAAQRLDAPLEYLHVLERHPETAAATDFSGAIGLGAQESLLQELSEADEQRSRGLREQGRELLARARAHAAAAGVTRLDARLRHGDFVDTAIELQQQVGLYVLGEHHHAEGPGRIHTDHHVERVIRGVAASVLVATADDFVPPRQVLIAFDGSPMARKALAALTRHPLLAGLPVTVVMAAPDTPSARQQLKEAQATLAGAGVDAQTELAPGEPQQVLPALVRARAPALLVMGAFGHSRLRQWLLGSTTTSLLRMSTVPVLVLR